MSHVRLPFLSALQASTNSTSPVIPRPFQTSPEQCFHRLPLKYKYAFVEELMDEHFLLSRIYRARLSCSEPSE